MNCHKMFKAHSILASHRSSYSQTLFQIGLLKNFAIFTEKRLRWSPFLIFLRRDSKTGVFLCILQNL